MTELNEAAIERLLTKIRTLRIKVNKSMWERMKCPGLGVREPIPDDGDIAFALTREHLPPMPADFMPEFTTIVDEETGNEMRVGISYGSSSYPGDRGCRFALCYVLSTPYWPEGRERQPQADALLRSWLWLAMRATDVVNSYKICKDWLDQIYPTGAR